MTREMILDTARTCVCEDRNGQYGEPEDNFAIIAGFWQEYLYASTGERITVTAADVASMMVLFKVARIATSTGNGCADSWIDIAGYAACGGEIMVREALKNDPSVDRH